MTSVTIKTEKQLYARLKAMEPRAHWQRIETGAGAGVPDVNVCLNGVEEWLELKIAQLKGDKMKIVLRDSQVGWISRRIKAGGKVLVVVGVGGNIMFLHPSTAIYCNKKWEPIQRMWGLHARSEALGQ